MRVLITGITGFAGSHLAEFLLNDHPEVELFGIMRWRSRTENIESIQHRLQLLECDLRDATSVKQLIGRVRPDRLIRGCLGARYGTHQGIPVPWSSMS